MQFIGRILLLAAVTLPLTVLAQESAKPAKSAQDCADELLRNKDAIADAGETPQEFFHRCWWDSVPGQPTPIKTPGATWNPGHGHPASKGASKITAESKKIPEHRKAAETKVVSAPKKMAQTPSAEPPRASAKMVETKPLAEPKSGVGPNSAAPTKPDTTAKTPVAPKTVPSKQTAGSKGAGVPKQTAEAKKTAGPSDTGSPVHEAAKRETAKREIDKRLPAPVKAAHVERASGPAAAAGMLAVKSHEAHERPKRVAAHRPRHEAVAPRVVMQTPAVRLRRHAAARPPYPSVSREMRPIGRPTLLVGDRRPARLARGGATVCLYTAPDVRGRSACVPMSFGLP